MHLPLVFDTRDDESVRSEARRTFASTSRWGGRQNRASDLCHSQVLKTSLSVTSFCASYSSELNLIEERWGQRLLVTACLTHSANRRQGLVPISISPLEK